MLELIEQHRVTHAMSIGPIAPQLLAYTDIAKHDLSSLRLFATMSRADSLEAHIKVPCSNLFGITEGCCWARPPMRRLLRAITRRGASGCPQDEIRLLAPESEQPVKPGEMGELCFRGPSSLTGFYNAPEANAKAFTSDGFYRTGDMMTAHAVDGTTSATPLKAGCATTSTAAAKKIGCEEGREFCEPAPAVADAKLVAMPDPFYGEKGCIFIIARPGMEVPDVKALAAFLTRQGPAQSTNARSAWRWSTAFR